MVARISIVRTTPNTATMSSSFPVAIQRECPQKVKPARRKNGAVVGRRRSRREPHRTYPETAAFSNCFNLFGVELRTDNGQTGFLQAVGKNFWDVRWHPSLTNESPSIRRCVMIRLKADFCVVGEIGRAHV